MANPLARANSALFKRVNRARDWWELPKPLALLNLRAFRDELRELNLYDTRATNGERSPVAPQDLPKPVSYTHLTLPTNSRV